MRHRVVASKGPTADVVLNVLMNKTALLDQFL